MEIMQDENNARWEETRVATMKNRTEQEDKEKEKKKARARKKEREKWETRSSKIVKIDN